MTSLHPFTIDATKQYLQSVVFIDDRIYETDNSAVDKIDESNLPTTLPSVYRGNSSQLESDETKQIKSEDDSEVPPFYSKQLVESFANEGIVCALYEPSKNFGVDRASIVFKLCERADIVVLDWDLFGDNGDKVSELVLELVKGSCEILPHYIRLIAIYTANLSLEKIQNEVYEKLEKESLATTTAGKLGQLEIGAVRIVFLGKPGIERVEQEKSLTVAEADLAQRLIHEFAEMHSGILPAYALHGMASIRRNSKRILDKFHGNLDGAFLLHRALVRGSGEAFDELPELLAEEVMAVIEDNHPKPENIELIADNCIAQIPIGAAQTAWKKGNTDVEHSTYLRQFLREGLEGVTEEDRKCDKFNALLPKEWRKVKRAQMEELKKFFSPQTTDANEQLASLFNLRTRYGLTPPSLLFGTIVRYFLDDTWNYGFCVMPLCDCIRLENESENFPFWKLRADISGPGVKKGISVKNSDGEFLQLVTGGKPRDVLWINTFQVNRDAKIVLSNKEDQSYWFDGNDKKLQWVAQLKPSHAQRIANEIAQSFSRVAVVEAEWLRLLVDR